jgi:hypothetical protein
MEYQSKNNLAMKCDLLADNHKILNNWKNYFSD